MNFGSLEGLTLTMIEGAHKGSERVQLTTLDGRVFRMMHHQDCCETVSVEDVVGDLEDLLNSPILRAEERSSGVTPTGDGDEQWTFYELCTIKGSVTIRWLGETNGYYGTEVSFEEATLNQRKGH